MRFILLLFVFVFSCTTFNTENTKKIYICGDRTCANKKEIKNYFDNNISIEVYTVTSSKKRDKDFDLVQLNMSKEEKDKYVSFADKENIIKKELKKRNKVEKINIKSEKKIKKIAKKNRKIKKRPEITLVRLCKNLNECDIDKVSKIIFDMGKDKEFPDITEQ